MEKCYGTELGHSVIGRVCLFQSNKSQSRQGNQIDLIHIINQLSLIIQTFLKLFEINKKSSRLF